MIIRALQGGDITRLKEIHEKFYKDEFEFPNLVNGFIGVFVVEDNGVIVSAGGIRSILESVAITNKDCSARARRTALFQLFDASAWLAGKKGYNQIHAFVQDEIWKQHLEKIGFHDTKGQALVLEL